MFIVFTASVNNKQDCGKLYSVHREDPFGGDIFLANRPITVHLNIVP